MSSPPSHPPPHHHERRVRMEDQDGVPIDPTHDILVDSPPVRELVIDIPSDQNVDTDSSTSTLSSEGEEAGQESDDAGHHSSRSRRSSASHWSASRRSSPPPELPLSPLLPSRRQSANAGHLTSEERMTLGMRRSSSRASRASRASRISRASGGVVSFEDDDVVTSDDEDEGEGEDGDDDDDEEDDQHNADVDDGDIEPLRLERVEAAFPTLPAFISEMPMVGASSSQSQPSTHPSDIQEGVPSPFPRPVVITTSSPAPSSTFLTTQPAPILSPSTTRFQTTSPRPTRSSHVEEEPVDSETLLEQSLLAGAWSAYRRTAEGRSGGHMSDQDTDDREIGRPLMTSTPAQVSSAVEAAAPETSVEASTSVRIPFPGYCEVIPTSSSLQREIFDLFAMGNNRYLTLRCGASSPTKVFTAGCASTISFFGTSLTLPSSPSNLAAWRTLIPVPMIWHKPSGRQEKWFATKEPPEKGVRLLMSTKANGEYEKRTVGVREAGGGRDCYVMACECCGNKLGFYFNEPPEAFKGYHWLFLPSLVTPLRQTSDSSSIPRPLGRPSIRSRQRTDPLEFLLPLNPSGPQPEWVRKPSPASGRSTSTRGGPIPAVPTPRPDPRSDLRAWPPLSTGNPGTSWGMPLVISTVYSNIAENLASGSRASDLIQTANDRGEESSEIAVESSAEGLDGHDDADQIIDSIRGYERWTPQRPRHRRGRSGGWGRPGLTEEPQSQSTVVATVIQPPRRATGVGNGVEMRQVLIDGRLMDVVVIGESDTPPAGSSSTQNVNGDVLADCPPELTGSESSVDARAWQQRVREDRAGLIRSANLWQAIRDAEGDVQLQEDAETIEEAAIRNELEAVEEQEEDEDNDEEDEDAEVTSEGTESGEEMNDDGGVPLRGWLMLDAEGQRARSRSRSRSRSRARSPARGRDHSARDHASERISLLRGSLRYASPQGGRQASCERYSEEMERENERVATWRYWKKLADEWQTTEPPLTDIGNPDEPPSSQTNAMRDFRERHRAAESERAQPRRLLAINPDLYGY